MKSPTTVSELYRVSGQAPVTAPVVVVLKDDPEKQEVPVVSIGFQHVPEPRLTLVVDPSVNVPTQPEPEKPAEEPSAPRKSRFIDHHRVEGNKLNEVIFIEALDERGAGNMNHEYLVSVQRQADRLPTLIQFQNGPLAEVGPNGLTNEALLAIVIDRLEGAQSGPFACEDNADALALVQAGLSALKNRTTKRLKQGVEGKNLPHAEVPEPAAPAVEIEVKFEIWQDVAGWHAREIAGLIDVRGMPSEEDVKQAVTEDAKNVYGPGPVRVEFLPIPTPAAPEPLTGNGAQGNDLLPAAPHLATGVDPAPAAPSEPAHEGATPSTEPTTEPSPVAADTSDATTSPAEVGTKE